VNDSLGQIINYGQYSLGVSIPLWPLSPVNYISQYYSNATYEELGYIFDGWYTEPSYVNKVVTYYSNVVGEFHLYARWIPGNSTPTNTPYLISDYASWLGAMDSDATEYQIMGNVYIPEGTSVSVPPGVKLIIPSPYGVYVDGELYVYGTIDGANKNKITGGNGHTLAGGLYKETGRLYFVSGGTANGDTLQPAKHYTWDNANNGHWLIKAVKPTVLSIKIFVNGSIYKEINDSVKLNNKDYTLDCTIDPDLPPIHPGSTVTFVITWTTIEGISTPVWKGSTVSDINSNDIDPNVNTDYNNNQYAVNYTALKGQKSYWKAWIKNSVENSFVTYESPKIKIEVAEQ
jgi:uncharacterized repeat protein (TIGR02543 family)